MHIIMYALGSIVFALARILSSFSRTVSQSKNVHLAGIAKTGGQSAKEKEIYFANCGDFY